jgi:hypothetical protein
VSRTISTDEAAKLPPPIDAKGADLDKWLDYFRLPPRAAAEPDHDVLIRLQAEGARIWD